MRYALTLPLALASLAAMPLAAQEAPPPTDPATPAPTETVAPPADQSDPADPAQTPAPVDTANPAPPPTANPAATPAAPAPAATTPPPATATGGAKVALTAEQKAAYDAWPTGARTYFDGLPASRQEIFLRLRDEDKLKIVALTPAQQATTWTSLEKQDAEQKAKTPKAP